MITYLLRRKLLFLGITCIALYIFCNLSIVNKDIIALMKKIYSSDSYRAILTVQLAVNKKKPQRLVKDVDCAAIFNGDNAEIEKAKERTEKGNYSREFIKDKEYVLLTRNCDNFKSLRGYDTFFVSEEEINFPIAFSILLYKDVEQTERLLRAIYAPQNFYCLHVDADCTQEVHDAIQGIANCFDNVFVVSRKEYVVYAGFTRLQADLNCMEDLLKLSSDWKYFINLPSQEFPLKSNKEIVKILKIFNGANDIPGKTGSQRLQFRYSHRYLYRHMQNKTKPKIIKSDQEKETPPYNITVVKGSAYGVFCRDFVHFAVNNKIARAVLDYFRDVLSPDEYYWATLNYNHHIGAPGSYYKGNPDVKPKVTIFAAWAWENPCHGMYVRSVCVFGVGDLKILASKPHLFANKFYSYYQPYALECMEEWHLNKTAEGNLKNLNVSYYMPLPFIKPLLNKSLQVQTALDNKNALNPF